MKRNLIHIVISIIFVFFIGLQNAYGEMKITEIERKDGKINIVLNGIVKINSIKIKDGKIDFPAYASKGRIYKEFAILQRDFNQYMVDSINKNIIADCNDLISFKINKFKIINNHKTVKAAVSVVFDNILEVECRVMKGKDGLWIAFPAQKQDNKWFNYIRFIDYDLKNNIETALISRYIELTQKK
ncbi:MAG: septation protein SpoVG family protein [Endomicrobium sp.]|jgi:DNA-binding cell septation regulator SpoVG|nr:septation protein SpoVG family protein [Endomicrobium sp.]